MVYLGVRAGCFEFGQNLGKLNKLLCLWKDILHSRMWRKTGCPFQQARSLSFINQLHSIHLLYGSQPPQKGTKCNVKVPDLISSKETLPFATPAKCILQHHHPFSCLLYQRLSSLLFFSCCNASHRRKPLRIFNMARERSGQHNNKEIQNQNVANNESRNWKMGIREVIPSHRDRQPKTEQGHDHKDRRGGW